MADSMGATVRSLTSNEVSELCFILVVSILTGCVSFEERKKRNMACRFEIMDKNTREYKQYEAVGRQIIVRLIPPSENNDPLAHFLASVNDLFDNVLSD